MKRIGVVHLLLTMDVGGLERVALDLVRRSDPDRFDARIICLRAPGELAPLAQSLGVPVEALGARRGLDGLARLVRRLRHLRPAVLHTHNPGPHRVGVVARRLGGVPVLVHTKHGRNFPLNRRAVAVNRRLSLLSDRVVAVSEDAADVARRVEGVPAAKVCVIQNGIEPGEPLTSSTWQSWVPRGITVARLDPVKDQPTMLRAVRRVVDACPEFQLDIVGDGPERAALETLSRELQIDQHVRFLGYRTDVEDLLRRPAVFLLSSVSEGISLTLLEAMAAGLPAVATDVGGNREVVVDGLTGALVSTRDPGALAEEILRFVQDPARARAFGAAGRARVEQHFDLRLTVERYEALYSRLLQGKALPR